MNTRANLAVVTPDASESKRKTKPAAAAVMMSVNELFGLDVENGNTPGIPVTANSSILVPSADEIYKFKEDDVRKALLWHAGIADRNLLIDGPTGCGKSSFLEQFHNRMQKPLYRQACHARLEFSDMVGRTVFLESGATKFVHGPLVHAMRDGGTFCMDEMNFLNVGTLGALNTVLDGAPLLIPETNELIVPHKDFRVCATSNAIAGDEDSASYRGTGRMNLAFLQRWLNIRADYLDPTVEALLLHEVAPAVPGAVIEKVVSVANQVRTAFSLGELSTTMGTRVTRRFIAIYQVRQALVKDNDRYKELLFALKFALTDAADRESAAAIESLLQRETEGMKVA